MPNAKQVKKNRESTEHPKATMLGVAADFPEFAKFDKLIAERLPGVPAGLWAIGMLLLSLKKNYISMAELESVVAYMKAAITEQAKKVIVVPKNAKVGGKSIVQP